MWARTWTKRLFGWGRDVWPACCRKSKGPPLYCEVCRQKWLSSSKCHWSLSQTYTAGTPSSEYWSMPNPLPRSDLCESLSLGIQLFMMNFWLPKIAMANSKPQIENPPQCWISAKSRFHRQLCENSTFFWRWGCIWRSFCCLGRTSGWLNCLIIARLIADSATGRAVSAEAFGCFCFGFYSLLICAACQAKKSMTDLCL